MNAKRPSYSTVGAKGSGGGRRRPKPRIPSCARSPALVALNNTTAASVLRQADDTPVPPFRAEQSDQQDEHDRHMPEIVFFHRRHAAPGIPQIVGERRGVA